MIRRFALALLIALAAVLGCPAQQASTQYQHIATTWTPDTGTVCSTTVTASCVKNYIETFNPPAGTGAANTVTVAWGQSSNTWTPGGFLFCGTWSITLVIDYLDETGVDQKTSAASTTVSVPCPFTKSPPSGFSASPKT